MPDRWDDEKVVPCWIVWGLSEHGVPMLLACDLSQAVADRHRRAVVAEGRWVRVYVENSVANHLYGGSMSALRLNAAQVERVRALPPQGDTSPAEGPGARPRPGMVYLERALGEEG